LGECICYKKPLDSELNETLPVEDKQLTYKSKEEVCEASRELDEMNRAMKKVLNFRSELHASCIDELQEMEKMGLPTYFLNSPWDKEENNIDNAKPKVLFCQVCLL